MSIKIMKIKRKKGLLLAEETLKIVIAVIAIGFLVYFLVSLYFSAKATKELEQAESSLNFILGEAAAGRTTVDIYNPKNWWLLSGNGELCICKDADYGSCIEKGVCETATFTVGTPVKIAELPITLNINQESKIITKATNGT